MVRRGPVTARIERTNVRTDNSTVGRSERWPGPRRGGNYPIGCQRIRCAWVNVSNLRHEYRVRRRNSVADAGIDADGIVGHLQLVRRYGHLLRPEYRIHSGWPGLIRHGRRPESLRAGDRIARGWTKVVRAALVVDQFAMAVRGLRLHRRFGHRRPSLQRSA